MLIIVPRQLSAAGLEKIARSERFAQVIDWLYA
jgi:hypothetical protein